MRWLINTVGIIAWLWGTDLFVAAFMVSLEFHSMGPCGRVRRRAGCSVLPLWRPRFLRTWVLLGRVRLKSAGAAQDGRSAAQVEGLMMKTWFSTLVAAPASLRRSLRPAKSCLKSSTLSKKRRRETTKTSAFELIDEAYENVLCALICHE
jgi:hypothetical protein